MREACIASFQGGFFLRRREPSFLENRFESYGGNRTACPLPFFPDHGKFRRVPSTRACRPEISTRS